MFNCVVEFCKLYFVFKTYTFACQIFQSILEHANLTLAQIQRTHGASFVYQLQHILCLAYKLYFYRQSQTYWRSTQSCKQSWMSCLSAHSSSQWRWEMKQCLAWMNKLELHCIWYFEYLDCLNPLNLSKNYFLTGSQFLSTDENLFNISGILRIISFILYPPFLLI